MAAPLPPPDLDHVLAHTQGLWEELRGRSVFMTGATGFVGTWLLESLLWANDRLRLHSTVAVLTRHPDQFRAHAPHLALHAAVRVVPGDLTGFDLPAGEFPFVVHAATEPAAQPDAAHALAAFDLDLRGTRCLLEHTRERGLRKFLFTSSGAVYGKQPPAMTHVDEDYAGAPATTEIGASYGHAKRALESMIAMHGTAFGFDAKIARLFAFVGPRLPLNAHYAVGNFIRDAMRGGPVLIGGDGTPLRSYLYAADLAIWLWTILLRGRPARPYNVGSPHSLSIRELAHTVVDAIAPGAAVEIAKEPVAGSPAMRYVPSSERAATELGLCPLISLDDGIRRTADWHRAGASSDLRTSSTSQTR